MYNIMIHNFQAYTPFTVAIKYWLYSCVVQYILAVYFICNSWNLLVPYTNTAPPSFPLSTGNH